MTEATSPGEGRAGRRRGGESRPGPVGRRYGRAARPAVLGGPPARTRRETTPAPPETPTRPKETPTRPEDPTVTATATAIAMEATLTETAMTATATAMTATATDAPQAAEALNNGSRGEKPGEEEPDRGRNGERPPSRLFPFTRSARARILASYLVLLAFSTFASVVAIREILLIRLDTRVDASLVREAEELRRLAGGRDPLTGRPFGTNVRRVFDAYLSLNVPGEDEALVTLVDGKPYRSSRTQSAGYSWERDTRLVRRWARLERTTTGSLETPGGPVRFLAVPTRASGKTLGTLVVAISAAEEREAVHEAVRTTGAVGLAVLVVASILAFFAAGRVLAPLRELDRTARSISDSDLTQRIVAEGDDEIAELSRTFNRMLDRLEAAFSSQRNFISDAGHELRTPITIVRGHLDLLGEDPAERIETVALVTDELDRMSRFVDDLLLLARAERPDFLRLDTVPLGPLVAALLTKARALGPRRWHLESDVAGDVVADRQRLTQGVMNLAENAVRHTEESAELALGASIMGGEARIWVSDTGRGIPLEDQARVFDRTWRGDGHGAGRGTGIGLAIVRAIAKAHGGHVEIDSRPGIGTRFTIVIPTGHGGGEVR